MPVQKISVVPAQETAGSSRAAARSRDKSESRKNPGRSRSRSSSKASSSTTVLGPAVGTRTSATPSSQETCSSGQLARLEECGSDGHKQEVTYTPVMPVSSMAPAGSQVQKKQVKRRHHRKRDSCTPCEGADKDHGQRQQYHDRSHSSDRGEKGERGSGPRREQRPRGSGRPQTESSSSEGEGWRQARSWSREKARRGRQRSGSSREREEGRARGGGGGGTGGEAMMELQSVGSEEGEGVRADTHDGGGGLKNRHGEGEGHGSQRGAGSQRRGGGGYESRSAGSSSLAEEGEVEPVTESYQEGGTGGGDMSAPNPQNTCLANGSTLPCSDDDQDVCRICHCEAEEESPLITPCRCTGSLRFVHQDCLNQWIRSSDISSCELCKYDFIMETQLKPLRKWEKLNMTTNELRKILCSVVFHLAAVMCVMISVSFLIFKTVEEIKQGREGDLWRISLLKYYTTTSSSSVITWPFWTKVLVVGINSSCGLIFMYIQCKVYLQLWRRLKAFNRIITVQNCPEKAPPTATLANGNHEAVEVPIGPAPPDPAHEEQTDSDQTDSDPSCPRAEENPV